MKEVFSEIDTFEHVHFQTQNSYYMKVICLRKWKRILSAT